MSCTCCRNEDRLTSPVRGVELCDQCTEHCRQLMADLAQAQRERDELKAWQMSQIEERQEVGVRLQRQIDARDAAEQQVTDTRAALQQIVHEMNTYLQDYRAIPIRAELDWRDRLAALGGQP